MRLSEHPHISVHLCNGIANARTARGSAGLDPLNVPGGDFHEEGWVWMSEDSSIVQHSAVYDLLPQCFKGSLTETSATSAA